MDESVNFQKGFIMSVCISSDTPEEGRRAAERRDPKENRCGRKKCLAISTAANMDLGWKKKKLEKVGLPLLKIEHHSRERDREKNLK